jgi:hypothetical protein
VIDASLLIPTLLAAFYIVHDASSNVRQSLLDLILNCMKKELKKSHIPKRLIIND